MELNRDNLRKIRGLIVFTIVILVALWKYAVVFEVIGFLLHIVFPFLLGGAIAFVLNVPMNFLQRNLFAGPIGRGSRRAARLAKPVSLILTILFVFGVISLVMLVVIPELGTTIVGLGSNIQRFFPKLQEGGAPLQCFFYLLPQGFPLQPAAIGHCVQKKVLFTAIHTVLLSPAYPHPYCKSHR